MKTNSTELENVFTSIQRWSESRINIDSVLTIERQIKRQRKWTLQGLLRLVERYRPVEVKELISFDEDQLVGTSHRVALRNFFNDDKVWRESNVKNYGNWEVSLESEGNIRTAVIRNLHDTTAISYVLRREDLTDEVCYQLLVERDNVTDNSGLHALEGTWRLAVTDDEQCPITLTFLA
ncbi:hypothetical protein ACI3E1_07070 [Ligilactobacillus sp. LYQ139]|uniref:hypothetical protein n=1 Tax=Ligilactobacillus sp. LYQ139 TaxID=3378800 RepID=UPI003854D369